ncbi:VOC family protein [Solibaculum mannosilyticum]|uniref:VOC family protein n=1 Tax=Solibaculum mannosilyticum TaxID=2780922 RepID=UPI0007A8741E|nr:3-demethylubiquinone-9 3-methyltransferase [Eubacteriaceae bacterium CHKCI005]
MRLFPQIILKGNASDAVEFYTNVLHAYNQGVLYYGDVPHVTPMSMTEEKKKQVMCAKLSMDEQRIYLCDAEQEEKNLGQIQMVAVFDKAGDLYSVYEGLKEGGQVLVQPMNTFDNRLQCIVKDRFGIVWKLTVETDNTVG